MTHWSGGGEKGIWMILRAWNEYRLHSKTAHTSGVQGIVPCELTGDGIIKQSKRHKNTQFLKAGASREFCMDRGCWCRRGLKYIENE